MFSLELGRQVEKFLDSLDDDIVASFAGKMQVLRENPFSRDNNLDIKPLLGMPKGHYRLRIGDYRFLYEARKDSALLYFYKADNRGAIYK